MKGILTVVDIFTGELPPEVGPPGDRLIVKLSNGKFYSMLIHRGQPLTCTATDLNNLANELINEFKK